MKHKKAQSSTEYMIVVAIAIAVILIVLYLLGGTDLFTENIESKSKTYWSTLEPIQIVDYTYHSSGKMDMILKNVGEDNIYLIGVTYKGAGVYYIGDKTNISKNALGRGEEGNFTVFMDNCTQNSLIQFEYFSFYYTPSSNESDIRREIGTNPLVVRCIE